MPPPPASTVLQPIAEAIATRLRALDLHVPERAWTRGELSPPCGEIELPAGDRTGPEESESQLGSNDWRLELDVTIWFDLTDVSIAAARLVDTLEAFVRAVDADRTLGLVGVLDASVTGWEPVFLTDQTRPLVGAETTVAVWALVP
jgi:hypothetical protein